MKKFWMISMLLIAALFVISCGDEETTEGNGGTAGGACTTQGAFRCSDGGATVQKCDQEEWKNFMQCNAEQEVCNATTGKCDPKGSQTDPTTEPTTEPTTDPTTEPTTDPTTEPTSNEPLNCSEIYDCMVDCGQDSNCQEACYNNGSATGQSQLEALLTCLNNNCSNATTDAEYQECASSNCSNEITNCFSVPGNTSYAAPYGHMDINVNATYIITNETQLDQSMVTMSYFATGTFGNNGSLQPMGAQGAYYYAMAQGNYVGVVQSPFANNGQTVLNPIVMMQFESGVSTGTVSAGLTQDDDIIILIFDSDAQGNTTCYHGFAVGSLTISNIDLTAGANGNIAITGSQLEIYSSENAPMYGGNITDDLNSPNNPWVPCAAQ